MEARGVEAPDAEPGIREDSWKKWHLSLGKKKESPPKIRFSYPGQVGGVPGRRNKGCE